MLQQVLVNDRQWFIIVHFLSVRIMVVHSFEKTNTARFKRCKDEEILLLEVKMMIVGLCQSKSTMYEVIDMLFIINLLGSATCTCFLSNSIVFFC